MIKRSKRSENRPNAPSWGLLLASLLIFGSAFAATAEVVIIANTSLDESSLSRERVQDIFLGKTVQWNDNSKIHPVTLKDDELHREFLKSYINRSPSQWNAYWKRMIFTGRGAPPKQVDSVEEMIEFVKTTKGAIGYVDAADAPEVKKMEVE